MGISLYLIRK